MEPTEVKEVFRGNLIRVEVWSGRHREIVRHPGACAVVALTPDAEVVLVRQRRESVDEDLLEIPAGIMDVLGELPRDCVARELLEETGYRSGVVGPLGVFYSSPGFTDERFHLFLARDVVADGASVAELEVVTLPLDDAVGAIRDGRIRDAKTAVGLLLAWSTQGRARG